DSPLSDVVERGGSQRGAEHCQASDCERRRSAENSDGGEGGGSCGRADDAKRLHGASGDALACAETVSSGRPTKRRSTVGNRRERRTSTTAALASACAAIFVSPASVARAAARALSG